MGIREFDRILKEKAASFNMIDTHFFTGVIDSSKTGYWAKLVLSIKSVSYTHLDVYKRQVLEGSS